MTLYLTKVSAGMNPLFLDEITCCLLVEGSYHGTPFPSSSTCLVLILLLRGQSPQRPPATHPGHEVPAKTGPRPLSQPRARPVRACACAVVPDY